MNTRKYPRTSAEAFPFGPEYGCAIERPMDKGDKLVMVACIAASVFMGILFIAEYLK